MYHCYTNTDVEKEIQDDKIIGLVTAVLKSSMVLSNLDFVAMANHTGVTLTQSQEDQKYSISGSWKAVNRAYGILEQYWTKLYPEKTDTGQYIENFEANITNENEKEGARNGIENVEIVEEYANDEEYARQEESANKKDPGRREEYNVRREHGDKEEYLNEGRSSDKEDDQGSRRSWNEVIGEVEESENEGKSQNDNSKWEGYSKEIRASHGDLFTCEICRKEFGKKKYLQIHLKRHQVGSKKFKCQICGWSFFERHKLKNHLETHKPGSEQNLPYKCALCSKQFHNKAGWSDHMNAHTDTRPWVCDTCNATFTYRSALKRHKITHSSKKFKCKTCDKSFSQKPNLHAHMSIHTGVTSHTCPCGKAYTVAASLKRHKQKCKDIGKGVALPTLKGPGTQSGTTSMMYVCGVCSKAFQTIGEAEKHSLTHCVVSSN